MDKIIDTKNKFQTTRLNRDGLYSSENEELSKNFPDHDILVLVETEELRNEIETMIEDFGLSDECLFTRVSLPAKEKRKPEICDIGGSTVSFVFPDGSISMVCVNEECGCRAKLAEYIKDFYLDKFPLAQIFGLLNYPFLLMMQNDKVPWVTDEFIKSVNDDINKSGLMIIQ